MRMDRFFKSARRPKKKKKKRNIHKPLQILARSGDNCIQQIPEGYLNKLTAHSLHNQLRKLGLRNGKQIARQLVAVHSRCLFTTPLKKWLQNLST